MKGLYFSLKEGETAYYISYKVMKIGNTLYNIGLDKYYFLGIDF